MGKKHDLIDRDYEEILHETDSAVLVIIDGDEYWLPLSQIEIDRDKRVVTLPAWLAKAKDLEV